MSGLAYYNEIDPYAAQWLRNLIDAGHIAPGVVDERSIVDVRPDDLLGYTQCHFFAGIGGWSLALRIAGWPDDKPVWTGSPPCQPFSIAGKQKGYKDERHLAPKFLDLITQCRPPTIFGEQVARAASDKKHPWLDDLQDALEAENYATGAVVLPACGVGAPHIRQRLWFVAEQMVHPGKECERSTRDEARLTESCGAGEASGMADSSERGRRKECEIDDRIGEGNSQEGIPSGRVSGGDAGGLADADSNGRSAGSEAAETTGHGDTVRTASGDDRHQRPSPTNGFWRDPDWLFCRDEKWRAVEPGFKQMVDGLSIAMGYMRDFGKCKEIQEAINATGTNTYAGEVMRDMQTADAAEEVWLKTGGQIGFYEATLLFAFMLEHQGKLGEFIDSATQGGPQACQGLLREMRKDRQVARSPSGRGYTQQPSEQLTNALPELPQTGALEMLATLNGFPLANGAPERVGRLRGYGNAIVPQVAAEFIRAYLI